GRRALLAALFVLIALPGAVPAQGAANIKPPQARAGQPQPLNVRWGFYITYNPNSWVSLQANAQNLNYVSPWFYNLNADAQVTGRDRPEVGTLLRQVGAKSLPMIQNSPTNDAFSAIMTDTLKQFSIVNQVDALVSANDYDGITIDFEGINAADKYQLTAFMGSLYSR